MKSLDTLQQQKVTKIEERIAELTKEKEAELSKQKKLQPLFARKTKLESDLVIVQEEIVKIQGHSLGRPKGSGSFGEYGELTRVITEAIQKHNCKTVTDISKIVAGKFPNVPDIEAKTRNSLYSNQKRFARVGKCEFKLA
jgi:hypothetical protein